MGIYFCHKCKFLFERVDEPEQCPDCGSGAVIAADEEQIHQYRKYREEIIKSRSEK